MYGREYALSQSPMLTMPIPMSIYTVWMLSPPSHSRMIYQTHVEMLISSKAIHDRRIPCAYSSLALTYHMAYCTIHAHVFTQPCGLHQLHHDVSKLSDTSCMMAQHGLMSISQDSFWQYWWRCQATMQNTSTEHIALSGRSHVESCTLLFVIIGIPA